MGLSLFKLEKLKITAYTTAARSPLSYYSKFEAMFNPTSLSQSYGISWVKRQGINSSGPQLVFTQSLPSELKLDLVLDGTGVDQIGLSLLPTQTVESRVKKFLHTCYDYNGTLHEPNYLLVEWGSLKFPCRLYQADIKYTLFNRDGTALRAELAVTLVSDLDAKTRAKRDNKTSPDLTHARIVRHGDTLPLLTQQIYGSSANYLDVARYNGLDDFRSLTPGQQLLFPPLATFTDSVGDNGGDGSGAAGGG